MPPKTLLRAGLLTLFIGVVLYAAWLAWLQFAEPWDWDPRQPGELVFWLCASLSGTGALLLLRAALVWNASRKNVASEIAIFPGARLTNVVSLRCHRPMFPIAELPNFGLIFGAILWILLFLFAMYRSPQPVYGLPIDVRGRDWLNSPQSPPRETLSVYLAAGEKYYVNSQLVRREDLRDALQKELNQRAVWVVYFEADYDTLNGDAIYAMDVVQGLGAKLIWITPKMRQELKHRE